MGVSGEWFLENEVSTTRMSLKIDKLIYDGQSDYQKVVIFKNELYGHVLTLDGMIQATEGDLFIYHEMLTNIPILSHGNVKDVLIIGGGDGQMLNYTLKHPGVNRATMVEIDGAVMELSKKYLPLTGKIFENPRGRVITGDGAKFVKETKDKFDVVIVDSSDPTGPAAVLFTEEFYRDMKNIMNPGGVMVTQSGVPMIQAKEMQNNYRNMKAVYKDAGFFVAACPTYTNGFMTLGWATDNLNLRKQDPKVIAERFEAAKMTCRYYTPDIHFAAFALPQYIKDLMTDAGKTAASNAA